MPTPNRPAALLAPLTLAAALLFVPPGQPGRPSAGGRSAAPAPPAAGHQPAAAGRAFPVASRGPGFGARFTAPYVESWSSPEVLFQARQATGIKYFTLAFVLSDGGCNGAFDGTIPVANRAWLGAVSSLRRAGGDVIVSFGGGIGRELALACGSVAELKAAYRQVVETFDLTRIDLDIEGETLEDQQSIDLRNQALAELQQDYAATGRKLRVQYTLPVNPWGLSPSAVELLEDARRRHLDVDLVNIMTMDYGPSYDMGTAAVRAATALHGQLAGIWPGKSSAQLWSRQGITPMIGVNDAGNEVFTADNAARLATFAAAKGIRLLAFWSLGRDSPCPTVDLLSDKCSGTAQQPRDFSRILSGASADLVRHWMSGGTGPAS